MRPLYCRVHSVVQRDNVIMLYLERPVGYLIQPMSLFSLTDPDENTITAPICNGNNIKAMRFIIPKNRKTYWATKLTSRDTMKVSREPILTFNHFDPTPHDVFVCKAMGLGSFTSYFTNGDYIAPAKFIYEVDSINDCFELALLQNVMGNNLNIYIAKKSKDDRQRQIIQSDERLKRIFKFYPFIKDLNTNDNVYISGLSSKTLTQLAAKGITYTNIPVSL